MYQYKVVTIGEFSALAQHFGARHVTRTERDEASIDEAIQEALDMWSEKGWKLHTAFVFDKRRAMLVMEKQA